MSRIPLKSLEKIRSDYVLGAMTQSGIAKRHGISRVTLWKLAKENDWRYASDREKALQKFNENSMLRMNDQRLSAVEDHAVQLTEIREKINDINSLEELSMYSQQVDVILKCIKGERLSYGLPNEIRHLDQKTEQVVRIEDALRDIEVIDGDTVRDWDSADPRGEGGHTPTHILLESHNDIHTETQNETDIRE